MLHGSCRHVVWAGVVGRVGRGISRHDRGQGGTNTRIPHICSLRCHLAARGRLKALHLIAMKWRSIAERPEWDQHHVERFAAVLWQGLPHGIRISISDTNLRRELVEVSMTGNAYQDDFLKNYDVLVGTLAMSPDRVLHSAFFGDVALHLDRHYFSGLLLRNKKKTESKQNESEPQSKETLALALGMKWKRLVSAIRKAKRSHPTSSDPQIAHLKSLITPRKSMHSAAAVASPSTPLEKAPKKVRRMLRSENWCRYSEMADWEDTQPWDGEPAIVDYKAAVPAKPIQGSANAELRRTSKHLAAESFDGDAVSGAASSSHSGSRVKLHKLTLQSPTNKAVS